jgi:hypothetical protein
LRHPQNQTEEEMKIYAVIIEDRHTGTTFKAFSQSEKAVAYAKEIAFDYSRECPEDFEELKVTGLLYFATYSCEDDSVRVIEVELNEEVAK